MHHSCAGGQTKSIWAYLNRSSNACRALEDPPGALEDPPEEDLVSRSTVVRG
jgi:hypothetical protein